MKVRFGRPSIDDDFAVVRAIRDAVGDSIELMVDCNEGWRMPWDTRRPWDLRAAMEVARALESERLYWLEEPLYRGDYDGYAELRRNCGIRIAGGDSIASTTANGPAPGNRCRRYSQCPWTLAPSVHRFMRLGPMPTAPRRPPVPNGITW